MRKPNPRLGNDAWVADVTNLCFTGLPELPNLADPDTVDNNERADRDLPSVRLDALCDMIFTNRAGQTTCRQAQHDESEPGV